MPLSDALRATLEVAQVLEDLQILYALGGSLASSLHGIPRSTQDADLVADLKSDHVRPLVEALRSTFFIDEDRVRDAVRRRSSVNVIHLATMTKVDLFVLRGEPFSLSEIQRRQRVLLPEGDGAALFVASAEDTVIQKLRWFVKGGQTSERQWNDILGVIKVQAGDLDLAYLEHWADGLGLRELLQKALADAGLW